MQGFILVPGLVMLSSLIVAITSLACSPPSMLNRTNPPRPTMPSGVQTMMVAPNHSKLRARVLKINPSPQFKDKWNLEIEILTLQPIQGGTFAQVGQVVPAFTIAEPLPFQQNDIISADAEYLGNPKGGQFRLTQVQVDR